MKRLLAAMTVMCCFLACETVPKEVFVTSVSLSQPTAEMIIGETISLSATVLPSNATDKSVTWASSNRSVATVADGKVTAVAEGSSTITASCGGKSASCAIAVKKKVIEVTSVELNKKELALVEGESETLVATVKPDDATEKTVTWTTSDATIATVDNGIVAAVKEGEATITAKAGDKTATCKAVISKKKIAADSIELSKTELTLKVGESETIIATILPDDATDKTVIWESSEPSVASVDNGVIKAISVGNAKIKAKTNNEKEAICIVTVSPLTYINVSESGTANCYIIPSRGGYCFNASVKGCTQNTVGNPVKAEVLWETFGTDSVPNVGEVVSDVKFVDGEVFFTSGKNGNAVIAVKSADNVILWSWHIWVSEGYNANEHGLSYKNDSGTMMDRNLGALTAAKGDNLSLGLLYQWGRKDPFPATADKTQTSPALTTITWPTPVYDEAVLESDEAVTGETSVYQVQHPMTFIIFRSAQKTKGSVWTPEKSESDPCPYGWKVPNDIWSKAMGYNKELYDTGLWDSTNYGIDGQELFGISTWYPAGSMINGRTGQYIKYLTGAGPNGYYWGANADHLFMFYRNSTIIPEGGVEGGHSHGVFVRCVKE